MRQQFQKPANEGRTPTDSEKHKFAASAVLTKKTAEEPILSIHLNVQPLAIPSGTCRCNPREAGCSLIADKVPPKSLYSESIIRAGSTGRA